MWPGPTSIPSKGFPALVKALQPLPFECCPQGGKGELDGLCQTWAPCLGTWQRAGILSFLWASSSCDIWGETGVSAPYLPGQGCCSLKIFNPPSESPPPSALGLGTPGCQASEYQGGYHCCTPPWGQGR